MIEKKYRQYYVYGYINTRNINNCFGNVNEEESFVNRKIKDTFGYLGIKIPTGDYTKWAGVITFFEILASLILVTIRFICVCVRKLFILKKKPEGLNLFAPLSAAQYRVKDMLRSLDGIEVTSVHIPFIKNSYKDKEIELLSVVSLKDVYDSFISAIGMVCFITKKFGKYDILFRSYSSFEYFLACRFVQKVEEKNKFVYYSTYDRWGFLFCGANTEVTFIQHGKLDYITQLIRVGTPTIAYYISPEQKIVLEDTLFTTRVNDIRYRKMLQFTNNEVLNHKNGKPNVLIVSASYFTDAVLQITKLLYKETNLYVKPHPGEKKLEIYDVLEKDFGVVMLNKTDYPEVDVVLSYNSTLADEYDMAGVRVIRWDLLKDFAGIREMVLYGK